VHLGWLHKQYYIQIWWYPKPALSTETKLKNITSLQGVKLVVQVCAGLHGVCNLVGLSDSVSDAGMHCEPDNANSGQHPGGFASCTIHICTLIFGTWPLLPLHYNIHIHSTVCWCYHYQGIFLIKLECTKAAVTIPNHSTPFEHAPSITWHPPNRSPSNCLHFIHMLHPYDLHHSILSHAFVSMWCVSVPSDTIWLLIFFLLLISLPL
jgi:hypothetical protein